MALKFLTGQPALLAGDALVIADLHIGIEAQYRQDGVTVPSQTGKMLQTIGQMLSETKAKRLVILGDVKHKVPGTSFQELRELPWFFSRLAGQVEIHVAKGNHDSGLDRLLPAKTSHTITLHPAAGFLLGGVYYSHGHTWPANGFLKASKIIIGHVQPLVEFVGPLGNSWREKAWVQADLDVEKTEQHYGKLPGDARRQQPRKQQPDHSKQGQHPLPKLILMPAFNAFAGGYAINRQREAVDEHKSPLLGCARREEAVAFLLDGTKLGTLRSLRARRARA